MTITTDRLIIRDLQHADLADLLAVNGSDETTQFLPYASWSGMTDAEAWYDRMAGLQDEGAARQFVIERKQDAVVIGSCLLFRFDVPSRRAELGYVLGHRYWRQGYMHEAMRAFVDDAFDTHDYRRLEAVTDPLNRASIGLLERLGFRHEGTMRQRGLMKGALVDSRCYGLLRDDPRPVA